MTIFLRLLMDKEKARNLLATCSAFRAEDNDARIFQVSQEAFHTIPGAPFAYWISDSVRKLFSTMSPLESEGRSAKQGLATSNDFRFIRTSWEKSGRSQVNWVCFSKGGAYSAFYADIYLTVNWSHDGAEIKAEVDKRYSHIKGYQTFWVVKNPECYLRPGLTWPLRTQQFGPRVLPAGCIFGHKGPILIVAEDRPDVLLAMLSVWVSKAYATILSTQLNASDATARSFEIGVLHRTVLPFLKTDSSEKLAALSRRAWFLKRTLDTVEETSHAFLLPAALRARLGNYDPPTIEAELTGIQVDINAIVFDLYGFSKADRATAEPSESVALESDAGNGSDDEDDEESVAPVDQSAGLISWAVGVAFGRFDLRLATGERAAPLEPEPFDPLPAKSPGMLANGAVPFHAHSGILVNNSGHVHDLTRLVEEVLSRVEVSVPDDVRHWLKKDFFAFHLQRYSKSRRKAPIYWPLSTNSGSYTLWVYYPDLTNQTLFTAVNDFLDGPNGKLTQVSRECADLRSKGSSRSLEEEKQFETLQALEQELIDLRDTLLKIAPTYHPNHDDGVQITAAPLWPLFRHKPWQKVLKDTWAKLEKGDYDWANLAMAYWPDRVREKCKTDKSFAIAHGLEDLYVESQVVPKKTRREKP